jgi:hypothetical protein
MPEPYNLVVHRETREGWPLLTPEANGIFWSTCTTYKRCPSIVGSLGSSYRYKRILSCLNCSSRPNTIFFPYRTLFHCSCPLRPSRWACSRVSICALAYLVQFKNLKIFFSFSGFRAFGAERPDRPRERAGESEQKERLAQAADRKINQISSRYVDKFILQLLISELA